MEEESTCANRITEKSPVEDSDASQAERDVYGADGRWLRRGAAEHISCKAVTGPPVIAEGYHEI